MVVKKLSDRIKNDTFSSVEFEYQNEAGTPLDITGATIRVQFRNNNKKGHVVKDITDGNGITATDLSIGKFQIDKFTPIDFEAGNYYYDVQTTFSNGDVKTYVGGTFRVIQDVTNG